MKKLNPRLILVLILILPWFTIPFLGKESVKKFLPTSLCICVAVRIINHIAKKRKWWWFYEKLHPRLTGVFPLLWGPFFVSSMWVLKLTYGNLLKYLMFTQVSHFFFTYFIMDWFRNAGILSLVRMKKMQLQLLFLVESLFLYMFQVFIEKLISKQTAVK